LFIGLVLLIFGAEIIIRGSVSLGKKLKVSLFAIGVVIVAGGTSLPELASSINAVITNHSDLAVGAVIGSNIANLILVMAATSFLIPISNINQNQINQAWINIGLAIILIIMSYLILPFNYLFGILSICLLFIIMFMQVKQGSLDVSEVEEKGDYSLFISIIFILGGIILLIYGSDLFVESAINIANQLNIPEAIIGVSLVAFGTSLPELVVGILSAIRKKVDFALGNVLGSNIYNVLGVLGVSSFFGNFSIPRVIGSLDLLFMLFVTLMILGFMIFLKRIGRTYGSIGLFLYVGYIVYVFN
jgi:cation:H+ antiporter